MKNPVVLVGVLAIIIIGLSFYLLVPETKEAGPRTYTEEIAEPVQEKMEARWLFAGELFWARQMERIARSKPNPYGYLFSRLDSLERNNYDAWLGHMECPVTSANISFETQANSLVFNCRPEYLPEFSKWFDAVSLANNHMGDVNGQDGLIETRKNLEEAGVQYYGHFDNSTEEDICEIVGLPVRILQDNGSEDRANFPIALCGYNNVFRLPTAEEISQINRYSKYFLTISTPQQGAEYQPAADEIKRKTYRAMVDYGADMVIASHPHWVQNTEVYNGKLIMYSLGNFMFDQEWSEEVKRGTALDLILQAEVDDNLSDWLLLECERFKDDCLKKAQALGLDKPKFELDFDLISVLHENGLTFKAPSGIHRLNIERTNWRKTLDALR